MTCRLASVNGWPGMPCREQLASVVSARGRAGGRAGGQARQGWLCQGGLRRSEMLAAVGTAGLFVRSSVGILVGSFQAAACRRCLRIFWEFSDVSSKRRVSGSSEWCRGD